MSIPSSPHPAIAADGVAFITGGASGIGLAVAARLLDHGMQVALIDRHDEGAVPPELTPHQDRVLAIHADVADRGQLERAVERVEREFGDVSVVMNNAAIGGGGDVFGDPAAWERLLAVNLHGVVYGCSLFAERMVESSRPGLITVSYTHLTLPTKRIV